MCYIISMRLLLKSNTAVHGAGARAVQACRARGGGRVISGNVKIRKVYLGNVNIRKDSV